jgi:hypothetical protein
MTIQQLSKTAPVTTLQHISFIGLFKVDKATSVDANNQSTEALLNGARMCIALQSCRNNHAAGQ